MITVHCGGGRSVTVDGQRDVDTVAEMDGQISDMKHALQVVRAFVADDAACLAYQTLGQYRSAVLNRIDMPDDYETDTASA